MGQNWAISSTTSPSGSNPDGCILQGMSGGLFRSNTGLTWNSVSFAPNVPLYGVTCGDNEFIPMGEAGVILKSNDGKSWLITGSGATDKALFYPIYSNGKYLAVGEMVQ
jgi:hypothetical protein